MVLPVWLYQTPHTFPTTHFSFLLHVVTLELDLYEEQFIKTDRAIQYKYKYEYIVQFKFPPVVTLDQ
jgi:hypothetical protein